MKELSIEQKAKRYDELKITAQELEHDGCFDKITLFDLFPELEESEDEKIRKEIISYIKSSGAITNKEWIDWLEKQGEQKPAWGEEDETTKNNISHIIRQYDKISKKENQPCWYIGDCLLWIQNIKDRVGCEVNCSTMWKPSDAQMESITCAVRRMKESACYDSELVSLLNDLKKLKEEKLWQK